MLTGGAVLILQFLVHMRTRPLFIYMDASSAKIAFFQKFLMFGQAHSTLFNRFFSDSIGTGVGYGLV